MKLVTFPGQGSSINLGSFKGWCESLKTFTYGRDALKKEVLDFVGSNLNNPGSIAVCSNLLFQDWLDRNSNKMDKLAVLGHSLGELSAINACSTNRVYSFKDIFEIANYRHGLMIAATNDHRLKLGLADSQKYKLWSITCVKSKDLRGELRLFGSLHVANHNSQVQCVITGLQDDFEMLKLPKGSRVNELENPSHIPFHDDTVLDGIQEPLYDYMKEKLIRNGFERRMPLDYPMICNVDGSVVHTLEDALKQFARSSTKTVEFPKCCQTALTMGTTSTLHIGPGRAVRSFLVRNMQVENSETYGE